MPQTDKTASPYRGPLRQPQFRWKTDPTFYPTARLAMESPQERYAYVTAIAPDQKSRADSVFVVDVGAGSGSFGKVIGQMDLPDIGAANLAQRRTADG